MADQIPANGVTWDLTSYFPDFKGPEMVEFRETLEADLKVLMEKAAALEPLSEETADAWEEILVSSEDLGIRASHIGSYVGCLDAAHTDREVYAQEKASLMALFAQFGNFEVDVLHALKDVSDEVFTAFLAREALAPVAHSIRETRKKAQFTMSRGEEKLATDLSVDGIHAWGRLYDRVTGPLEWDLTLPDGSKERLPISQWRARMSDVDREKGRAAFQGGNEAWAGIENVCCATLNALAGTRLTLNRHRKREHFLDPALFQSSLSRETLDAMYEAIYANIETARDIFRSKAEAMGRDGIFFFEREAPLPVEDSSTVSWEKGAEMVGGAFNSVYPALGGFYHDCLERRWIESEVRGAKRPGAFCTGSPLTREQRVYMTFNGTLGDVRTLAHEVGHAWHSHILKELRPPARHYPMTLAETASTFGEAILADGLLSDANITDTAKLSMLDADLSSAAVMLLDITVRFEFEKAFHEERLNGEVPVSRLKELMVEAQKRVFGDALAEGGEDPYFWASKLHFYISGVTFYNFPYTFGFLLSRALYVLFEKEGDSFLPKYEEFLRLTGSDTVEGVAKRSIGADLTDPAFWAESIKSLEAPLAQYKELLAAL
jgi:oligoendopeptidase F